MRAPTRLWIDDDGQLWTTPPPGGFLLATEGQDLNEKDIVAHGLETVDGEIRQNGKVAKSLLTTPAPLVADRTLWVDSDGLLTDKPPEHGVKIADEGQKIPRGYVVMHNLEEKDGEVIQREIGTGDQKEIKKPTDKAVKKPSTKEAPARNSGLTIEAGE